MEKNFAFIDTQNVNLSVRDQWWKLDRKAFRIYLQEKYHIDKAYLFIGYIHDNQLMYTFFQTCGYILIFKPVLSLKDGTTKWNVDAELVLQSMIDYKKYDRAIIVTGDSDFSCLVKYLYDQKKLLKLIVPNKHKYSLFLKKTAKEKIDNLTNLEEKLSFNQKKGPTT